MAAAPVFLNHFFLTLDAPTFRAIRDSAWMQREWAPFEQRTTRRNDTSYTGIYFYGRNTYFEFFQEGEAEGKPAGACGVAFGVEQPGAAKALAKQFPVQRDITRKTETVEPVWFASGEREGAGRTDFFRTWVMEYHADFLKTWYPDLAPANANSLRRRNVLDRYVAKIGQAPRRAEFLMKDITAIDLELPPAEQRTFLALVETLGYQVSGEVATGPEIRLAVRAAIKPAGIRAVSFSLQRSVTQESVQRFGSRSQLTVRSRGDAQWVF
ncbi:MAG: DUF5829 family protein [Bryobacteraceae bacterium]